MIIQHFITANFVFYKSCQKGNYLCLVFFKVYHKLLFRNSSAVWLHDICTKQIKLSWWIFLLLFHKSLKCHYNWTLIAHVKCTYIRVWPWYSTSQTPSPESVSLSQEVWDNAKLIVTKTCWQPYKCSRFPFVQRIQVSYSTYLCPLSNYYASSCKHMKEQ